jgi:hypothetical protein
MAVDVLGGGNASGTEDRQQVGPAEAAMLHVAIMPDVEH